MSNSLQTHSTGERGASRGWRVAAWLVIVAWVLSLPPALYHANLAWESNSNRVEDWIPTGHRETVAQDRFIEMFGSDELLAVTWDGCQLGDPALDRLARLVEPENADAEDLEPAERALSERVRHYFRRVTTGNSVLRAMLDSESGITQRGALARMHGWILGDDGHQTGAIGLVSDEGMLDRRAAVEVLIEATQWASGLSKDEIYVAGPTIESVAIDEASRRGLLTLNLISFLIAGLIIIAAYRNFRAGLLLLGVALYNEQLALAVVSLTGGRTDAVLLLMANITFVLSISAGCHLMRYFREALIEVGPERAPLVSLAAAVRPMALATLTSVIGFGSLALSDIVPIKNFGIYSGVMIALLGMLVPMLVMASYLALPARGWHRKLMRQQKLLGGSPSAVDSSEPTHSLSLPLRIVLAIARRWAIVIPVFIAILVVGATGLPRLTASLGLSQMFPEDAKVVRDYRWIEEHFTPLVPIEIVITVPGQSESDVDWLAELGMVNRVAAAVREVPAVESVITSLNFMPTPPLQGSGFRHIAQRRVFQSVFPSFLDDLGETGSLIVDEEGRHWRISGRMRATIDQDYFQAQTDVQREVAAALAEVESPNQLSFQVSGGALIFERMQKLLLRDLGYSLLMAVGLIGLVMAIALRNPFAGAVSMLPNVLPPVVIFGVMGWLEWPLEIGSVLTASAAIGVAVDDTLHLIYAFALRREDDFDQVADTQAALEHCGPAMFQTTAVCCCGMVVFAASQFTPIQRFAWVISVLLFVALICDLILLPALLISPIGRKFYRRR